MMKMYGMYIQTLSPWVVLIMSKVLIFQTTSYTQLFHQQRDHIGFRASATTIKSTRRSPGVKDKGGAKITKDGCKTDQRADHYEQKKDKFFMGNLLKNSRKTSKILS